MALKWTFSPVMLRYGAESGAELHVIKQQEMVTGGPFRTLASLCSVLGSYSSRVMCFFPRPLLFEYANVRFSHDAAKLFQA